jgi:c-di-GMP-binding flagellar brake protein YcgR
MHQPSGTTSQAERLGAPLPPAQVATAVSLDGDGFSALPRHTSRRDLPVESPGRMVLANGQSVFVTLHDISRGGCCVVRKGSLALKTGDRVLIEMWREDIQTKASLVASVRWVRHHDAKTKAGLRFLDNSVKTHRLIDQYLQRSFNPRA